MENGERSIDWCTDIIDVGPDSCDIGQDMFVRLRDRLGVAYRRRSDLKLDS